MKYIAKYLAATIATACLMVATGSCAYGFALLFTIATFDELFKEFKK